jgi:hypothetical protein
MLIEKSSRFYVFIAGCCCCRVCFYAGECMVSLMPLVFVILAADNGSAHSHPPLPIMIEMKLNFLINNSARAHSLLPTHQLMPDDFKYSESDSLIYNMMHLNVQTQQ